jgi:hypothetical protein
MRPQMGKKRSATIILRQQGNLQQLLVGADKEKGKKN